MACRTEGHTVCAVDRLTCTARGSASLLCRANDCRLVTPSPYVNARGSPTTRTGGSRASRSRRTRTPVVSGTARTARLTSTSCSPTEASATLGAGTRRRTRPHASTPSGTRRPQCGTRLRSRCSRPWRSAAPRPLPRRRAPRPRNERRAPSKGAPRIGPRPVWPTKTAAATTGRRVAAARQATARRPPATPHHQHR